MKIIKVYPHNCPLHIKQSISIFLASFPYTNYSSHDIKIISSATEKVIPNKNIIYLGKIYKESLKNLELCSNIDNSVVYNKYFEDVIRTIQEINPDLIEVELDLDLAANIASHVKHIPIVLVSHLNLIKSSIFKNIKRFFKIKKINAFIFVSNYYKKRFLRFYPFYAKKCYVVHNSYKHIKEDLIFDVPKENQIIFLGRAHKKKGIKEYIEGASQFLLKNKDWQAVLVGAFEHQKEVDYLNIVLNNPVIKSLIQEKRILLYKNFTNDQAFNELKKSKIAVFPTIPRKHQEGIPLVALEAGLAKCLIISSNSGGYSEINPFKQSILKNVSSKAVLEKLEYFSQNEEDRESLAKEQYEFIKETFLFDNLMQKFDIIREDILKNYRKTL